MLIFKYLPHISNHNCLRASGFCRSKQSCKNSLIETKEKTTNWKQENFETLARISGKYLTTSAVRRNMLHKNFARVTVVQLYCVETQDTIYINDFLLNIKEYFPHAKKKKLNFFKKLIIIKSQTNLKIKIMQGEGETGESYETIPLRQDLGPGFVGEQSQAMMNVQSGESQYQSPQQPGYVAQQVPPNYVAQQQPSAPPYAEVPPVQSTYVMSQPIQAVVESPVADRHTAIMARLNNRTCCFVFNYDIGISFVCFFFKKKVKKNNLTNKNSGATAVVQALAWFLCSSLATIAHSTWIWIITIFATIMCFYGYVGAKRFIERYLRMYLLYLSLSAAFFL
ncbi:hypothetical protein RFI_11257 [Reticulomyxa filosa]|uniref:Uncharacterized protein n=1 Tax=Reticulomyxa filosa TaxID=46433 RepID=X6NJ27_RETFI|nr:hypothetical protein RFI_11257 [Reticulomyxa filosa]|eukprot:ETO25883.1 hypothetical protein RFI_11257 [Reticulomyxa filosa]